MTEHQLADKRYGVIDGEPCGLMAVRREVGDGETRTVVALPWVEETHRGSWQPFDLCTQAGVDITVRMAVVEGHLRALRRGPLRSWNGNFIDFEENVRCTVQDLQAAYAPGGGPDRSILDDREVAWPTTSQLCLNNDFRTASLCAILSLFYADSYLSILCRVEVLLYLCCEFDGRWAKTSILTCS